jgi:hypothetical protein
MLEEQSWEIKKHTNNKKNKKNNKTKRNKKGYSLGAVFDKHIKYEFQTTT